MSNDKHVPDADELHDADPDDADFDADADTDDDGYDGEEDITDLMGDPIGDTDPLGIKDEHDDEFDDARYPGNGSSDDDTDDADTGAADAGDDTSDAPAGANVTTSGEDDADADPDDAGDAGDDTGEPTETRAEPADPDRAADAITPDTDDTGDEDDEDAGVGDWADPVPNVSRRVETWIHRQRYVDEMGEWYSDEPSERGTAVDLHPHIEAVADLCRDADDDEPTANAHWAEARANYRKAVSPDARDDNETGKTAQYFRGRAREHAAAALLDEYHVAAEALDNQSGDQGGLYVYNEQTGLYEPGRSTLRQTIDREIGEYATRNERNEIIDKVYTRSIIDDDAWNGGEEQQLIPAKNGVIDLDAVVAGEPFDEHFRSFEPTDYMRWKLDAPYWRDVNVADSRVAEFMKQIQPDPVQRKTMLGFAGHALKQEYEPQGFLIMCGSGGDGKTTFADLVAAMFGGEDSPQVAAESLKQLTNNRFSSGQLRNAQVNVAPDLGDLRITEGLSNLKKFTGGDVVSGERKNVQKETFKSSATMIYGANNPPIFESAKDAIARRLYYVDMQSDFVKPGEGEVPDDDPHVHEYDANIVDKITTESELAAFLKMALDELVEVEKTNEFAQGREMSDQERLSAYETLSDVRVRMARELLDEEPGAMVLKDHLKTVESNYSQRHDEQPLADKSQLTRILTNETELDVEPGQSRKFGADNDRDHVYKHIRFSDAARDYMPDRIEAEYFDDADEVVDEDGIIPLADAAKDPSGYVEVTGRVVSARTITTGDEVEDGMRVRLSDETATMDLVVWGREELRTALRNLTEQDDPCIRVVRAQVGDAYEHDGHELKVVEGTRIYEAEPGVGYIPFTDSKYDADLIGEAGSGNDGDDTGGEDTDAEGDDGEKEEEYPRKELHNDILAAIDDLEDGDNSPEIAEVIDALSPEYDEQRIKTEMDQLITRGDLYQPSNETIMIT